MYVSAKQTADPSVQPYQPALGLSVRSVSNCATFSNCKGNSAVTLRVSLQSTRTSAMIALCFIRMLLSKFPGAT